MKQTYILICPLDDSGNDDGVLDRKEFTHEEAYSRNEDHYKRQTGKQWVLVCEPKPLGPLTHVEPIINNF